MTGASVVADGMLPCEHGHTHDFAHEHYSRILDSIVFFSADFGSTRFGLLRMLAVRCYSLFSSISPLEVHRAETLWADAEGALLV